MVSSRRLGSVVLALLCVLGGVLVLSAPALARNVHVFSGSFGGEGSEDGKLMYPGGIAVNETTHDVYVADEGNSRVQEFTSGGVYIGQFAPPGGFGVEKYGHPSQLEIAVDNSGNPLDPSAGDVYVSDDGDKQVDKFSETGVYEGRLVIGEGDAPPLEPVGVAVDQSGVLWVSHTSINGINAVESFSDAQINTPLSTRKVNSGEDGLAVDAEGGLYIQGAGRVEHVNSFGEQTADFGEGRGGVAVDTTTGLAYAGEGEKITAYNSEARAVEGFGSGHLVADGGVAVDSSTHTVYVTDSTADQVVVFDQVVVPDASTGEQPTNIEHEGSVTLVGSVDPDGLPVTSCVFEYGTEASYGSSVPCEPSPGSGSSVVNVHADVSGLAPLTLYHYRVVAGNTNGSTAGIDRTFIAPAKAKVDGESVLNVASTSATFAGQVNPDGGDTTYRFEYGLSSSYGQSVSGNAGAGDIDVEVAAHPQDLNPGSTYHYRLVAESALGMVAGEDRTFITQTPTSSAGLPDGRAWEMVTPPNKQGSSLRAIGGPILIQAAADGSAITYDATGPTEATPPGDRSPENVQIFSRRGPTGWSTKVIATPHNTAHVGDSTGPSEYKIFSADLSIGLVEPLGATRLSEESSERTPYLRVNAACETGSTGCYQPLLTSANVTSDIKFGGKLEDSKGEAEFIGATPDLSHVIIQSRVALTPEGSPGLYEWTEGRLTFIADMTFGMAEFGGSTQNAVSEDGSHVIGTVGSGGEPAELLMRDIPQARTARLDVTEPGAAGGKDDPLFQIASTDASRVFFTDTAQLTTDSSAAYTQSSERFRDLYEFDSSTGKVSDLSVPLNAGEHADVQGSILGASNDGSYIYFVANGVLAAGATPGDCREGDSVGATCNLYVSHDGMTKFVATLSGEDAQVYLNHIARVSPDGQWLTFVSDRDLTGYDNRDAYSGKPDEEVYLYHAGTGPGVKPVVCVSCNPTGGRPAGAFIVVPGIENGESKPLVDAGSQVWAHRWLAAALPKQITVEGFSISRESSYLSDSGRLFFDSADPLVSQDTNGTWDVYEYEPAGEGSCESTGASFVGASGGCISLISSGGAHEESVFLDASENGDDAFFLTDGGLVPQDYDGAQDVYDAHVCSSVSPCLPTSPTLPPACSTGDSCKTAPTPQPESFGAPSSETFSGTGNVTAPVVGRVVASKSLTGAQKLQRALKACRKKSKRRRTVCERQARKRYAKRAVGSRAPKSVSGRTKR